MAEEKNVSLGSDDCRTISFEQVDKTEVFSLPADRSLVIIGNGFDLMHGIPSSYYNFRDSIDESHPMRFTLEVFIDVEDVWGDFESNLAYLDRESMLGPFDMWFEAFGVLDVDDDDFSAADYFAAQEIATTPVYALTQELPKIFRKWVESLEYKGTTKPLEGLINKETRYINFNYTEFLESIYGVHKENILYIHGDRRDKRCELVLGHGHNLEEMFEEWYQSRKGRKEYQPRYDKNDEPVYLGYFLQDQTIGNWKSQVRFDGIHNMLSIIEDYYGDSAKKTMDVLEINKEYFESLGDIQNVIIIGHSLSDVDDPYFREIIKNNRNNSATNWHISWYDQAGLESITKFVVKMGLVDEQVKVFQV